MNTSSQAALDYTRIEKAIRYLEANYRSQPSLDEVAAAVHLSPFHFQRLFTRWAGVSPKKFIQYLSLEHAKQRLGASRSTVLDTAYDAGLSGTGRLHDLFVSIEGMTPGEYKSGGAGLAINHRRADSPFGPILVASTPKGVCSMQFTEDDDAALAALRARFPNAAFRQAPDEHQAQALRIFQMDWSHLDTVKLHLAGTPFQLKVWESLLHIPAGALSTYGDIAQRLGRPQSSRAVGGAVGANPVAYLIPCHRVIRGTGALSSYRWGTTRKAAIQAWEAARLETAAT